MKSWNEVKNNFSPDGSLRDLYVLNTDISVWNNFLNAIKSSNYKTEFIHNTPTALPENFATIKTMQEKDTTVLKIFVDNKTQISCYFFTNTEIELDVDPSSIDNESQYKNLTDFMNWLSDKLKKEIILTHEDQQNAEILKVTAQTNSQ